MKDPLLISLIVLAEAENPIEHDVTLVVGGFLISGFITSYNNYIKCNPTAEAFEKAINIFKQNNDQAHENEKEINFIHLHSAKYYVPGVNPIPSNTGIHIRIPLESVQGFSFGKFEVQ